MTLGTIDDKEEFRQAVRFQLADYTVCVRFPTRRRSCARNQEAEAGTTYVNKIMTSITGWHKVIWSVEGDASSVRSGGGRRREQGNFRDC